MNDSDHRGIGHVGHSHARHGEPGARADESTAEVLVTDPVCGMSVKPDEARSAAHQGHTYYFCSDRCRTMG